jgi:hypothetical protein
MNKPLKIAGIVAGFGATLLIGSAIGASGSKTTTLTRTVTRTVTVHASPAPAVTVTVTARPKPPAVSRPRPPAVAGHAMSGDGTFIVGPGPGDWAPGTWQTSGAAGGSAGNCYWATLSDLTGGLNSIAANGDITGPTVITVGSGLAGVQVSGCNTWHRIS